MLERPTGLKNKINKVCDPNLFLLHGAVISKKSTSNKSSFSFVVLIHPLFKIPLSLVYRKFLLIG